jgi:hypothetical protein
MSNTTNDGGPAFPRPASEYEPNGIRTDGRIAAVPYAGMTLRDWFAGMALPSLCKAMLEDSKAELKHDSPKECNLQLNSWLYDRQDDGSDFAKVALASYILADAMITARNRKDAE